MSIGVSTVPTKRYLYDTEERRKREFSPDDNIKLHWTPPLLNEVCMHLMRTDEEGMREIRHACRIQNTG